jgi:hypothetical protein
MIWEGRRPNFPDFYARLSPATVLVCSREAMLRYPPSRPMGFRKVRGPVLPKAPSGERIFIIFFFYKIITPG